MYTQISKPKEISVIINTALRKYNTKNKDHLENIKQELELKGIPCVILQGELVGVHGELCWVQQPNSSTREYFYNF